MPGLEFSILSCSSESQEFPSSNLISGKPWMCEEGEDTASVELKFAAESEIESVVLTNNGSSIIQISVLNPKISSNYKEFIQSTFMKNQEDTSGMKKLRVFEIEDFGSGTATKKWSQMKIVCHKGIAGQGFGISQIRIKSPSFLGQADEGGEKTLGLFRMKKDPQKSPTKHETSFFNSRGMDKKIANIPFNKPQESLPNLPSSPSLKISQNKEQSTSLRGVVSFDDDGDDDSFNPITKAYQNSIQNAPKLTNDAGLKRAASPPLEEMPRKHRSVPKNNSSSPPDSPERNPSNSNSSKLNFKNLHRNIADNQGKTGNGDGKDSKNANKYTEKDPKAQLDLSKFKSNQDKLPFDQIMSKFTFAISGIQNPERAEIRRQIAEMGGVYESDLGPTTTYLICAFSGTPKFKEMKARNGKVISSEWIDECHHQRRLIPDTKYLMHDAFENFKPQPKKGDEDFDEEDMNRIIEQSLKDEQYERHLQKVLEASKSESAGPKPFYQKDQKEIKKPALSHNSSDDEETLVMPHRKLNQNHQNNNQNQSKSAKGGANSDGNLTIAFHDSNHSKTVSVGQALQILYEDKTTNDELPSFLLGCTIHLHFEDKSLLSQFQRYIIAYDGNLEKNPQASNITHVIASKWTSYLDSVLNSGKIYIVTPDWLIECHKRQKKVPERGFFLKKSSF